MLKMMEEFYIENDGSYANNGDICEVLFALVLNVKVKTMNFVIN